MTLMLKDPEAALDYAVDWGSDYLGEDVLVQSGWTVEPVEADGLGIAENDHDGRVARVVLGGGVAGHLYRLVNHVETHAGRRDARSFTVRVEKR